MSRKETPAPPVATEFALPDWSARSVVVHPRHPVAVTCVQGTLLVTMEGDPEDHVLEAGETLTATRRGRLAVAALGPSRVRLEALGPVAGRSIVPARRPVEGTPVDGAPAGGQVGSTRRTHEARAMTTTGDAQLHAQGAVVRWFDGFEAADFRVNGVRLHARTGGPPDAPPLLLLHGFPQSHVLWHRVAQRLARQFRLVLPDLRGYGRSDKPPGDVDHSNYSKRTMAADVAALMKHLGHERFFVAGHDRGARVAHRLALDHPDAVARLVLVDIAPTLDMYDATDMDFARAYYHWFHLIQPAPLPEQMIAGCAREYLHAKLGGWGSGGLGHLEPQALEEYERTFCTPQAIHAACEDYRASAGIDLVHDRASRAAGRKIACDLLVLWGEHGVVDRLFDPVVLWRTQCAASVDAMSLPAGHFIPEELPSETAGVLREFLLR